MKNKIITLTFGFLIGIINGLLGAGGGMIAVPALKKLGMEQKDAHRNAVAVILPLSVLSAVLYILRGTDRNATKVRRCHFRDDDK